MSVRTEDVANGFLPSLPLPSLPLSHPPPLLLPYRLKPHPPSPSSQCVLRQFIQSVLVLVRVLAMEGGLQADRLCVGGPLRPSQLSRLGLLSRLVVAMDAACATSEPQYLLQCVVTIYGLLVPILQHGVIHPGLLNVSVMQPLLFLVSFFFCIKTLYTCGPVLAVIVFFSSSLSTLLDICLQCVT